jgi:hypothetical protein
MLSIFMLILKVHKVTTQMKTVQIVSSLRYVHKLLTFENIMLRNENFTIYTHYLARLLLIRNQSEINDITKGQFRNVNTKDKRSV